MFIMQLSFPSFLPSFLSAFLQGRCFRRATDDDGKDLG